MNQTGKDLLYVAAAMMFFLGFEISGFQLLLLDIAIDFQLNTQALGLLVAAQYAAGIFAPLLFGRISDLVGKKKVAVTFAGIFAISCAFVWLSRDTNAFFIGALGIGVGFSVSEITICAAVMDTWGNEGKQRLNFTQSFFALGAVTGPIVTNFLIVTYNFSWRIHFFLVSMGFLLIIPFLLLSKFTHLPRSFAARINIRNRRLLTLPFLCLCVCMIIYTGLESSVGFFLDLLITSKLAAPQVSAIVLSAFWLSVATSRMIYSRIRIDVRYTVLSLFFISAVLLLFLPSVNNVGSIAITSVAVGLVFGPLWPTLISMAGSEHPDRSGTAISIIGAGSAIGGMASPMLFGFIAGGYGLKYSYWALSVTAFVGVIATLIYLKNRSAT